MYNPYQKPIPRPLLPPLDGRPRLGVALLTDGEGRVRVNLRSDNATGPCLADPVTTMTASHSSVRPPQLKSHDHLQV